MIGPRQILTPEEHEDLSARAQGIWKAIEHHRAQARQLAKESYLTSEQFSQIILDYAEYQGISDRVSFETRDFQFTPIDKDIIIREICNIGATTPSRRAAMRKSRPTSEQKAGILRIHADYEAAKAKMSAELDTIRQTYSRALLSLARLTVVEIIHEEDDSGTVVMYIADPEVPTLVKRVRQFDNPGPGLISATEIPISQRYSSISKETMLVRPENSSVYLLSHPCEKVPGETIERYVRQQLELQYYATHPDVLEQRIDRELPEHIRREIARMRPDAWKDIN